MMRTSAAALELYFTEPSITAAKAVCAVLHQGKGIDRPALLWALETAYGTSAADGGWSLRDAYDVLELAQVLYLTTADLPSDPMDCFAALTALTASLPTHTVRSEEQIALQQFSTPASIAYLASLAARVTGTDTVLEPSAGTGLLAVFAARTGASIVLNEIDPARAEMLAAAFPGAPVIRRQQSRLCDPARPLGSDHRLRRSSRLRRQSPTWGHRGDGIDRPRPQDAGPLCRARTQLRRCRI
jgi:predicted RNA methylase